jgi:isoquinoline 1-oxidoreductase subunit beta
MKLLVNGTEHDLDVVPGMPLLWALRDFVGLTGTKFGCGIGLCGACVVHIDGKPVRSCLTPVSSAAGKRIATIEGVSGKVAEAVQTAWQRLDVVQCGYCQSGQIMSAIALLNGKPKPADADIENAMDGNVCRCATYIRIRAAIHEASSMLGCGEWTMYAAMLSKRLTAPSSRRNFLIASAAGAGALIIGCAFGEGAEAKEAANGNKAGIGPKASPMPDAFIRIAPDDSVTVLIKHLDMGQGVTTGLTTIVAEELDADWSQMRAEFAPANAKLYNNLAFGPMQGTGGSTSVANSWDQLRSAAAASRGMLIAAAAEDWKVPASEITVHKGRLSHRSGKSGSFGQFAEKAAHLPLPSDVTLKDPAKFGLIGAKTPRIDSTEKTTDKAIYAQDIRRPGMLTVVIARPPRFGGTVNSFDASGAKAVKGVVDVIAIPQGVAVLAENTWAAMQGRDALKVQWDESKAEHRSSAAMLDEYKKLAATPGTPALKKGDADSVLAKMRESDRSGVHVSLSGSRSDGAFELHDRKNSRRLRNLGRIAVSNSGASHRRRHPRTAPRSGANSHALGRRFVRPSRHAERRLYRRGGECPKSERRRPAYPSRLDARRRHHGRPISPHVSPFRPRRPRRLRKAPGVASSSCRSVFHPRNAARGQLGQKQRRCNRGRRHCRHALCGPQPSR